MLRKILWMILIYKLDSMPCKLICWETLEVEYIIDEIKYLGLPN